MDALGLVIVVQVHFINPKPTDFTTKSLQTSLIAQKLDYQVL